jgi:hypothetical protein
MDKWELWFDLKKEHEICMVSKAVILAVGPMPPLPQFSRYWELFPQEFISQSVKLTAFLHLVQKLRMSGAIIPLPHMPLWHA